MVFFHGVGMTISGPGGGGLLDPDGAMEWLSAWKGRIDELAADTKVMSDRLQELRVTAADDNDPGGRFADSGCGCQVGRPHPYLHHCSGYQPD
jgi:hypothetical protein